MRLLLAAILVCASAPPVDALPTGNPAQLAVGRSSIVELSAQDSHYYRLSAPENLLIEVENLGRATVLTASRGDSETVLRSANWRSHEGRYRLALEAGSDWLLEVAPDEPVAPAGNYRISVLPWPADDVEARAEQSFSQAMHALLGYYFGENDGRDEAARLLEQAVTQFRQANNPGRLADALFEQAGVHFNLGNHDLADRLYEQAGEEWQLLGDSAGIAAVSTQRGLVAWRQNRLPQASTFYADAVQRRAERGDAHFHAQALNNLGLVHRDVGDPVSARALFQKALDTWQGGVDLVSVDLDRADLGTMSPAPRLGDALVAMNNLAWAEELAGDPLQAERIYRQALTLSSQLDRGRFAGELQINLSRVRMAFGDLDEAITLLESARDTFRDTHVDEIWEGHTHHGLALAYRASGDFRRARLELEEALRLRTAERDPISRAATLLLLAELELDGGAAVDARNALQELDALQLDGRPGRRLRAQGARLVALSRTDTGAPKDAIPLLDDAISEFTAIGEIRAAAGARLDRASLYLRLGDHSEAIQDVDVATEAASKLQDRFLLLRAHVAGANVQLARGQLRAARQSSEAAVRLADAMREQIVDITLLRNFSSVQREAFDIAVHVALADDATEPAWRFAERSRAVRLSEMLVQRSAGEREISELATYVRYADRREQLSQQLESSEPDSERITSLRLELAETLAEIERLQTPVPERAGVASHAPGTLPEVQSQLDDGELLLSYHVSRLGLVRWSVSRDDYSVHRVVSTELLDQDVDRVFRSLRRRAPLPDASIDRLSNTLLGRLGELDKVSRLLVSADGLLHYLPFSILVDPASTDREVIVAKRTIVGVPSARWLSEILAPAQAGNRIAVLADPIFGRDDPRVIRRALPQSIDLPALGGLARSKQFARLPGTRAEAEKIRDASGNRELLLATGASASRDLVISGRLADYDVLHFATHGVLDDAEPAMSGLMLSAWTPDGKPLSPFLRTQDIVALDLSAQLVVLSGCETGAGRRSRGEGVDSMARAFLQSGVDAVISTLWAIPDRAASEFMGDLYNRYLGDGLNPDEALRIAQDRMRRHERWSHPYYWAAFQYQGRRARGF